MTSRKDKVKAAKKVIRNRRFSRFTISASITCLVITLGLGFVVYHRYHTTQTWQDTRIKGALKDVPPEFAKNTYSIGLLSDINELVAVKESLNHVTADNGLTSNTIKKAKTAYDESKQILSKYKITGGESFTNQERLGAYIMDYEIEQSAYTNPDASKLTIVIDKISQQNLNESNPTDTAILSRLDAITNDYSELNNFVDTYVPQIGNISGNLVTVKSAVTKELTGKMLSDIEKTKLYKFTNIRMLKALLTSNSWTNVINNNADLANKSLWDKSLAIFNALSKSEYLDISSIKTYGDAKKAGIKISGDTQKVGYDILDDSPIDTIRVDGQDLNAGQYVRKSAAINATIKPTYKRNASVPVVPSEPTNSTGSSTSSNQSNSDSNSTRTSSTTNSSSESSSSTSTQNPVQNPAQEPAQNQQETPPTSTTNENPNQ